MTQDKSALRCFIFIIEASAAGWERGFLRQSRCFRDTHRVPAASPVCAPLGRSGHYSLKAGCMPTTPSASALTGPPSEPEPPHWASSLARSIFKGLVRVVAGPSGGGARQRVSVSRSRSMIGTRTGSCPVAAHVAALGQPLAHCLWPVLPPAAGCFCGKARGTGGVGSRESMGFCIFY